MDRIEKLARRLLPNQMVVLTAGDVVRLYERAILPDEYEQEMQILKSRNSALLESLKDLVARFPEWPYEGAFSKNARDLIRSLEGVN